VLPAVEVAEGVGDDIVGMPRNLAFKTQGLSAIVRAAIFWFCAFVVFLRGVGGCALREDSVF